MCSVGQAGSLAVHTFERLWHPLWKRAYDSAEHRERFIGTSLFQELTDCSRVIGILRQTSGRRFPRETSYASVLNSSPYDRWDQFRRDTVAELLSIGDHARAQLLKYLANASDTGMRHR
jgi:hypothetical protein